MPLRRRSFLRTAALSPWWASTALGIGIKTASSNFRPDVAIIGGGLGGCAAALAACTAGLRVILTEETSWIGGQLTSQGVPPDEHPWIESFGCTRSYREFRNRARQYYRDHYRLSASAVSAAHLNPGNGLVSRLCLEPKVSRAVLGEMLAPFVRSQKLQIWLEHVPVAAETDGDVVKTVRLRSPGGEVTLEAPYFIDATELGDLLPMTGTEFVIGAEARRDTGEAHAPDEANPLDQQAVTWCFAVDYDPKGDHTIAKPEDYAFWRDYIPNLRPPWPGKLLSWDMSNPITLEKRAVSFDPTGAKTPGLNLFTYRRLLDPGILEKRGAWTDLSLVNWPQNDYWIGPLLGVDPSEAARHLRRSKELSLSLLYWMQTEAPRPDGGNGWKGLRPRGDALGTSDGLAKAVYVREARRIRAEFTVLEQHVSTDHRMKVTGKSKDDVRAEVFPDSVGVGAYRIDLHPSTSGNNYIDLSSLPFQIPLGALLPRRIENLLPACKNIGTTHITNGCYRLHPVEWNIGEAAGWLAAEALRLRERPRHIRNSPKRLADFQALLRRNGFELEWPEKVHAL